MDSVQGHAAPSRQRLRRRGLVVPHYMIGAVPMSMILFLLLQPFLGDEVARGLATQFRIGPDN